MKKGLPKILTLFFLLALGITNVWGADAAPDTTILFGTGSGTPTYGDYINKTYVIKTGISVTLNHYVASGNAGSSWGGTNGNYGYINFGSSANTFDQHNFRISASGTTIDSVAFLITSNGSSAANPAIAAWEGTFASDNADLALALGTTNTEKTYSGAQWIKADLSTIDAVIVGITRKLTTSMKVNGTALAAQVGNSQNFRFFGVKIWLHPAGYSITYNCDGAETGCPTTNPATGQTALPNPLPVLTKTGFTFDGWYTDSEKNTKATPGASISSNTTLYANWIDNSTPTYAISYNSASLKGADVSSYPTEFYEGTGIASFPALADVTDFHFNGWNPASIGTDVTTDVEVFATWVPAYNVTFSAGEGSGTVSATFQKWEGATFELPGQGSMVAPSGKVFDGWKVSTTKYAAGAEYTMGNTAVEFVAQWKAAPKVLYYWQSSYSGSPTMNSAETVTGGTIEWKTDDSGKSWGNESYNKGSNDVPADLQVAAGKKAVKSGGNALYAELTLAGTETFQEGDTIYVGGYKKWMFSTTKQRYDGSSPTDDATKPMSGDIALISTGSSNSSYDDGYAVIPAGVNVSTMYLIRGEGASSSIAAIKVIRPVKYTVSFAAGDGGTGTMEAKKYPAGATVTLPECTFTAPSLKEFDAWTSSDVTISSNKFTMPANDVTVTATWKNETVKYVVTYKDGDDVIDTETVEAGQKPVGIADPTKTLFTFEGWQKGGVDVDPTMVTISAATIFTAKWSPVPEIADTYIWKKGTGYTGCVASPDADAPAAQYTSLTVEGMDAMTSGRASTAGTVVTVTITATQAGYALKSICTYGKLEEPAGADISWDGGITWTHIDSYSEQAKTFDAPIATFPSTFQIKFVSASTSSGGLWWRNALVTLELTKTEDSRTETLQDVKVEGVNIDAADLTTLQSTHALDLATEYVTAPEVTFVKHVVVNFTDGSNVAQDEEENVTATVVAGKWQAQLTINSVNYVVTLAKPTEPVLTTEATALTLASEKIATDTKSFTFSGANLAGDVTIAFESPVAGLTVFPAVVSPVAGVITDQEVTITYQSDEDVAAANVVLVVKYNETVKKEITINYSSTAGFKTLVPVTGSTTWDFSKAATSANVPISNTDVTILANYDIENDPATIETDNLEAKGERVSKTSDIRANYMHFVTTVSGKLSITYSNTGSNPARYVYVNGAKYDEEGSANKDEKGGDSFVIVPAGDVIIEVKDGENVSKNVQIYLMKFTEMTPNYTRDELSAGKIGTLFVGYATSSYTGATFYELAGKSADGQQITFEEVAGQLEADKPYIFEASAGQIDLYYADPSATQVTAANHNGLYGVTTEQHIAASAEIYYFSNNQLYKADAFSGGATDLTVGANRCYIKIAEVPGGVTPKPGRKYISLHMNGGQVATGIGEVQGDKQQCTKVLINGTLFILRGEKMYDTTGRLVK